MELGELNMKIIEKFKMLTKMMELVNTTFQIGTYSINQVLERYKEPHRYYHTLAHLERMCVVLDGMKIPDYVKAKVALGILYHDAVYDVNAAAGLNEMASAKLLMDEGFDIPDLPEVICAIMDTNDHKPTCSIGTYLCIIDLDDLINPLPEQLEINTINLWKEAGSPDWKEFIEDSKKFVLSYSSRIGAATSNVLSYFDHMENFSDNTIEELANGSVQM